MRKAAIVPFFDYGQGNEKLLWEFFILHARKWAKYVDDLVIISSGMLLTLPEDSTGLENMTIVFKPAQSHWQNMNEAVARSSADSILLLDSDMITYNPEAIRAGFDFIEEKYDFASILDTSGSAMLFPENRYRYARARMCPYLCFLKKAALRPDFDFTPRGGQNWTDSMGTITEQALEDGKEIYELRDDRSTISLEDDGAITSTQWLDTPPKDWALKENPDLGYYHIRNFGGGLKILKDGNYGLVPGREAKRLLAWVLWIATKTDDKNVVNQINKLCESTDRWDEYINDFASKYHTWIKTI